MVSRYSRSNIGGYRLECANGGLAPNCTECVPCDVAMQVAEACDDLRAIAREADAGTGELIMKAVYKVERAAAAKR